MIALIACEAPLFVVEARIEVLGDRTGGRLLQGYGEFSDVTEEVRLHEQI